MKIDWKRKLTSRKFWAAVVGFIVAVVTVFAIPHITAEQVELLGWALAALIAYIVGEGLVDASANKSGGTGDDT